MKKKSFIQDTINDIEHFSSLIKESYIFDDADIENEDVPMDDELEQSPNNAVDKINQIRTLALEGIQEFAEDVDCEEYDFFKKIWLMCDKVCSEKDKEKEEI